MRKIFPFSAPWPGASVTPWRSRRRQQELTCVDSLRRAHGRHDRGGVVVGREELEPHRLDPLAAGAAEADVVLESSLEPAVEQHAERDVEPLHERDGRREGRVEVCLSLPRPLPVEVEARQRPARVPGAPARRRRRARPGGVISAFCEPEIDDVHAPFVGLERDCAEARDGVDDTRWRRPPSPRRQARGRRRRRRWTSRSASAGRPATRARPSRDARSSADGDSPHSYASRSTSQP